MRFAALPAVMNFDVDSENDSEYSRIAMINFAFNNSKIIGMLKDRGAIVKAEAWKDLRKQN
jgi:hypothetical protein